MKRITIIVCGFSLAIALVALPFQYMEHITSGLGLSPVSYTHLMGPR